MAYIPEAIIAVVGASFCYAGYYAFKANTNKSKVFGVCATLLGLCILISVPL